MSYSIFNSDNGLAVQYRADANQGSLSFFDSFLENDVKYGLSIPFYLQSTFNGRTYLSYPPERSDIKAFALAYKRIIYEGELVKSGFYLRDDSTLENKLRKT